MIKTEQRLKELGKKNVVALIVDSIYAKEDKKTPSEGVAKEMLKDVLLGTESKGIGRGIDQGSTEE